MITRNRMLATCVAVGLVLIAVGLIVGTPTVTVEGAYFDRANGVPAAGVFSASQPGLLDPADGNLWLGAGAALLIFALCVAGGRALRPRPSAGRPD